MFPLYLGTCVVKMSLKQSALSVNVYSLLQSSAVIERYVGVFWNFSNP